MCIFAALFVFSANLPAKAEDSNAGSDLGRLVNKFFNEMNSVNQKS